jgi:two-component sensor histidine kinase
VNIYFNIGVRTDYKTWEVNLTRKLNFLSLVGFFNVSLALILFEYMQLHHLTPYFIVILCLAPFVPLLNKWMGYTAATYLFFIMGAFLIFSSSYVYGFNSLIMLYYFPLILSLIQLIGRKETIKHLVILLALYFISIIILSTFLYDMNTTILSAKDLRFIQPFSIISSFFSTLVLLLLVTWENLKQDQEIRSVLGEKELLLAELNHRVKNNMNIVTSLLNLKKDTTENTEVIAALDDCRFRVYSMALIHNQMYNTQGFEALDFKEYLSSLVLNIEHMMGDVAKVIIHSDSVMIPIQKAVPCGLIVNELLTNAYKHARSHEKPLTIQVKVNKIEGHLLISIHDNGPGINTESDFQKAKSLGFELVRSLCEQIDGKLTFENKKGFLVQIELPMIE